MSNYKTIDIINGLTKYKLEGLLHRLDGPALVHANGDEEWFRNGERHREDGPACIFRNSKRWYINGEGYTEEKFNDYLLSKAMNFADTPHNHVDVTWYGNKLDRKEYKLNGKLHRLDGPAMEYCNEPDVYSWYLNGKLHRIGGPAISSGAIEKRWYANGVLHREDGPASINCNGVESWYVNGKRLTKEEFEKLYPPITPTPPPEITANVEDTTGKVRIVLDGVVHYAKTITF